MTRAELVDLLRAARVDEGRYLIDGFPGADAAADPFYELEAVDGGYRVRKWERGAATDFPFADEDAACQWLYTKLTNRTVAVPRTLTAEELTEGDAANSSFEAELEATLRERGL